MVEIKARTQLNAGGELRKGKQFKFIFIRL
jgi:hypothetical protein